MGIDHKLSGIQVLLRAVDANDDDAAEAVALTLTAEHEAALLLLLQGDDPERQWWVIRALGVCGRAATIESLLPFLEEGNNELRAVALMALGKIAQRHPQEVQPFLSSLMACLADPDGLNRQIAADALVQCGNNAIPVLIEKLRYSTDQGVRSRAAYALGKIGTMEAAPALYRCLNDPNYLVHTYAHEALDKMGLLENVLVQL